MSMLAAGGIKVTANGVDYATVWIPKYLRAVGNFEGLGLWPNGSRADVGQWLSTFFSSSGANNQVGKNYPDLDAKIAAQQKMSNLAERIPAVKDIQRYMVENAVAIPVVFTNGIESVDLSWAGLGGREYRNFEAGAVPSAEVVPHYWLDQTLRSS